MGFFEKLKQGLAKTSKNISSKIDSVLAAFGKIDEELFEELEEALITADIGVDTTLKIIDTLRKDVRQGRITQPEEIRNRLVEIIGVMMEEDVEPMRLQTNPSVILMIGVNGVGKTTTAAKLAKIYKDQGRKVIFGAADTFRAAAAEQLAEWANRVGVDIIKSQQGADPAAVVFDTISAAKARGCDLIICDTAGRLHNKVNLMNELAKIQKVIATQLPDADTEVLLVLDATTGQNAMNQAVEFKKVTELTGVALTKLDGTAKGGMAIPLKVELGLPIRFVGVGEQMDDLQQFNGQDFAKALF
ncbi:MAG: signal recognition particle-docking protein FtsY [Clostridia bacterium]|nr:signal recognition particle-docking protein FtsY [Clostridia bacterium]MBR4086550.1 signal recognition particle-docking protein FtsY [Clostridia bacterium]